MYLNWLKNASQDPQEKIKEILSALDQPDPINRLNESPDTYCPYIQSLLNDSQTYITFIEKPYKLVALQKLQDQACPPVQTKEPNQEQYNPYDTEQYGQYSAENDNTTNESMLDNQSI